MRNNYLVFFITIALLFFSSASAQQPQDVGEWSDPISLNLIPAAIANLPDGRLLTWSSRFNDNRFDAADGFTYTEIFDPNLGTNGQTLGLKITDNNHNMFCPGINNLADGRILVAGGGSAPRTTIYDPQTETWIPSNNMNVARAYQGNVTLANGEVFTLGGQWDGGSTGKIGEVWTAQNGWKSLPGIPMEVLFNNNDLQGGHNRPADHAWLWAAPNGKVFHAGPSEDMHWLDVNGNGSYTFAGKRSDDAYAISGTTVMYDIGKILKVGGAINYGGGAPPTEKSFVIDINDESNVTVTRTANDVAFTRTHHNSVVLPNGEVFIVGGLSTARTFFDGGSRLSAEIWNPQTNMWRTVADMQVPRNYHSVSILMMDGRIFTGGGGLCNCVADHQDAEIYSPPYLFDDNGNLADRPEISAPATADYNQTFQVQSSDVITSFSFVRMSSATHSVNNEQRRVPVSFSTSGNTYSLNIPDANVMPAGYYMLFAMDENGVPSIAEAVHVLPNTISVTGIELSPNSVELPEGRLASLNKVISPSNASDQTASWSSADNSIATVDADGNVTAVQIGTTTITATTNDGGFTAQSTITVIESDGLCIASGEILMERYDGISGVSLDGLFNSPNFPDNPSSSLELTSFEIPTNVADNYGVRVSGYVCAPETGTYYFWISGDDQSRLNLSSDNDASNIVTIANVPGWTFSREWNKYSQQKSVGIDLIAGQSYYVEAFMKEAGGGDNLAVGWRRPSDGDGGQPAEVIPGNVLSSVDCAGPNGVIPEYNIDGIWQSGQNFIQVDEGTQVILSGLPNSNAPHTIIDPQGNTFPDNYDLGAIDASKTGVYTVRNKYDCETTIEIGLTITSVTGVSVEPTTLNIIEGETANLTATISPNDADDQSVTWSSDNESVAEVDTNGQVTAISEGTTRITVTTNDGGFTAQVDIVVISTPKPTQSTPIFVDSGARRVWVANPDNNTVSAFDADNLNLIGEYTVAADPVSIAKDSQENIWVTCRDAGLVQILNAQGTVVNSINLGLGSQPYGIVSDPEGDFLYITLFASNKVVKLEATSQSIIEELSVFARPRAMAITADGSQLFITQFITENNEGKIAKIGLANFNLDSNVVIAEDDFSPNTTSAAKGVANYLGGIAIQPESDKAWFTAKKDNTLTGTFQSGQELNFATTIRAMVSSFSISAGNENVAQRVDIDNHSLPTGITISPSGNYVFVTMLANNRIVVLDANNGLEVLRQDVGFAPSGITIDPSNNRLFVKNFLSRSIHVFDANALITQGTGSLPLLSELSTVSNELLGNQVLQGKQIFYNARDSRMTAQENSDAGYISCASCHIDGTYDGQTWDFTQRGEGLRNTISLRGRAGSGHGNVHWTGNFDEIHDFENDIRNAFGGTGFMTDQDFFSENRENPLAASKAGSSAELDALNAYIESLDSFDDSPNKNENGTMTSVALQGKALFNTLQCANCHSGEAFTNSATGLLHDIGTLSVSSGKRLGRTLQGFDVPTLRDVWATPPYLHDGSAATLKDAVSQHAIAASLSQNDLDLLEAYLLELDGTEAPASDGITFTLQAPSTANTDVPVPFSVTTDIPNIDEVIYYVDDIEIGRSSAAPYTLNFSTDTPNNYCIYAKAVHQGMATISKNQTLIVTGSGNVTENSLLITLEGEDFVSVQDGSIGNYLPGFQGTGFLDLSTNSSFGEWQFQSDEAVTASLTIVYNSGYLFDRSASLEVNGTNMGEVDFSSSANCFSWQSVRLENIVFQEGINSIRVVTNSIFGGVDIDFLEVELPPKSVTGVTLDLTNLILTEGETTSLTATVTPVDADDTTVVWTSSDDGIATVDANGLVTAISEGTATITVTTNDGGFEATAEVTVSAAPIPVTGVTVAPTELTLTEDETTSLTATISPADATDQGVVWSSSDDTIAMVDANGLVTALTEGTVTITVTTDDGGFQATSSIEVIASGSCALSNVALGGTASQSSTYGNGEASLAIDGNTTGTSPWSADLQHTNNETTPWWQVDLGGEHVIEQVRIFNRTNSSQARLRDFYVFVSSEPFAEGATLGELTGDASLDQLFFSGAAGLEEALSLTAEGRYVRVQLSGNRPLHMAEVQVMGCLSNCNGVAPPQITAAGPYLDTDGLQALSAVPAGGTWSGASTDGTFDPSIGAGTYTVTYTYDNGQGCTRSDTIDIVVQAVGPGGCALSNVALGGTASQSSTYGNGEASLAIDGNTTGTSPWSADLQHTNNETTPWWQVDLGGEHAIEQVRIFNRTNSSQARLRDFYVFVSSEPFAEGATLGELTGDASLDQLFFSGSAGLEEALSLTAEGRYVRVQLSGNRPLHMAEVQVMGCLSNCNGVAPPQITAAGPYLDTDGLQALSAVPAGGTWSGASTDGTFDPSIGAGTYTVTYTYDNGQGCTRSDTIDIVVQAVGPGGCALSNVALGGTASQSSTYGNGEASLAIDGNTTGTSPWSADLQHTNNETTPWWQVDLGGEHAIEQVRIFNRTNSSQARLRDFYVFVSSEPFAEGATLGELTGDPSLDQLFFSGAAGLEEALSLTAQGRYVRVQLSGNRPLHMAEVQVMGCSTGESTSFLRTFVAPNSSLRLSPVPASTVLIAHYFFANDEQVPIRMTLFDAMGRDVHNRIIDVEGAKEEIDISHLPSGTYLLQVIKDEEILIKRFTIRR